MNATNIAAVASLEQQFRDRMSKAATFYADFQNGLIKIAEVLETLQFKKFEDTWFITDGLSGSNMQVDKIDGEHIHLITSMAGCSVKGKIPLHLLRAFYDRKPKSYFY